MSKKSKKKTAPKKASPTRNKSKGQPAAYQRLPEPEKPTPKPVTVSWYNNSKIAAGLLFVFSFLLYTNTLSHDFALDDAIVITDNVITQQGPKAWGELFSHDTFYGFFQDDSKAQLVAGGRYRPLSLWCSAWRHWSPTSLHLLFITSLIWFGMV